ncbi:beta-ketoacyl synthase N-terminal-like domain-containing protein [Sphingobacterium hungaricum]|uniref:Beta-ketoacyl synthase n=1 Tax=Sphingobacterium hungaricum TaxID=2082723 RepID=A0A928UYT7_9SPHI|nr:beta-ketoacyl synthase N-terminal-like domain-containing protein [Sphingobacterium hungaricum]MBE8713900.1 beta-ketoacyl synthase [Sphingobacterium hungaricum]
MFEPIYIADFNVVTPIGFDLDSNWNALMLNQSGIARHTIGKINEVYVSKIDDYKLAEQLGNESIPSDFSRLEKLLYLAGKPLLEKIELTDRTAFILSTTKGNVSNLSEGLTDDAYLFFSANKIAQVYGFKSKAIVVSNACVSGLSAVALAKRLIQMGQFDDAVIFAGDEVSEFVLSGFQSFQAVSDEPCKPFDLNRKGVTLGEATAAMYISKKKSSLEILGESSISDANHISGPSRTGEGLYRSILGALKEATIDSSQIDFISAHGTATLFNDEMEAIAFNRASLAQVPVNSLKGFYGHTLGASGLLELILSCQSLLKNKLIVSKGFEELGVSQSINIIQETGDKNLEIILKTASGFGGSNSAMLVKKI